MKLQIEVVFVKSSAIKYRIIDDWKKIGTIYYLKKRNLVNFHHGSKRGIAVEDAKKDTRVHLISWIIHKF